jgi:hypothetical protein
MGARLAILADLEATIDRHWFGSETVLRAPVPAQETAAGGDARHRLERRLDEARWIEPERIVDDRMVELLLPYHRAGGLAFMTDRPAELLSTAQRRLERAGLAGAPIHAVGSPVGAEHPAHAKRRLVGALDPILTIEDDLLIAEFISAGGHETLLLDDRYNRGPIRSIDLMRIARADLRAVLRLRLQAGAPELDQELHRTRVPA